MAAVVLRWPQDSSGDHPSRGGSGNEPGGWMTAGRRGQVPRRRGGGAVTVKVRRLLTTQMTATAAWEHSVYACTC